MNRTHDILQQSESGDHEVSAELLQALKDGVKDICLTADTSYWNLEEEARKARFNEWDGQSSDGRKWEKNMKARAKPFNGASDLRVHLLDGIVRFKVGLLMLAMTRSIPAIMPLNIEKAGFAGRLTNALKWLCKNRYGGILRREWRRLANWILMDGKAVMGVQWDQPVTLRSEEVSVQDIAEVFVLNNAADEADEESLQAAAGELVDLLTNTDRDRKEALAALADIFPAYRVKRHRAMLKDFQTIGSTRIPVPVETAGTPRFVALRVGQDIHFDPGCGNLQEAHVVFHAEYLTKSRLAARAAEENWSDKFVQELTGGQRDDLGHIGKRALQRMDDELEFDSIQRSTHGGDQYRYEVITSFRRAVDDEGRVGIYSETFSCFCDYAATDSRLVRSSWGYMPYVYFDLETLGASLLDTRSLPEKHQQEQATIKRLGDMAVDNATLSTLPPIRAPHNRPVTDFALGPIKVVRERRPNEVGLLNEFKMPTTAMELRKEIERFVAWTSGLHHAEVPEQHTQVLQQDEIENFLGNVIDVYKLALRCMLQNMSEEQLERITGGDLDPADIADTLEGEFSVILSFDVRHLDGNYVKEFLQTLNQTVLPMAQGNVDQSVMGDMAMRLFDPNLADLTIRDNGDGTADDVQVEQDEIARILAGFAPQLHEWNPAINWQVRKQVGDQWAQANQARILGLDENTRNNLLAHFENVEQQAGQMENQDIGRTGVSATPNT